MRRVIVAIALPLVGCARKSEPITGAELTAPPASPTTTSTPPATSTSTPTTTSTSTTTSTPTPNSTPTASASYSLEATYAAQDAGMKRTIMVPYPAPCPLVKPVPSPQLAAHDKLASFIVDFDAFLRGDVGVEQAVALLGKPVLCNHQAGSRFMEMELAPVSSAVNGVTLETQDEKLIGIVVELDKPARTNLADVSAKYASTGIGAAMSHRPGSDGFKAKSAAYEGALSLFHDDFDDPPSRRMVRSIIMRRFARSP